MMSLCCEVLKRLEGKTLVTAESLTGGGIGAALTAVPGSSAVYKGGIICYTNWVKAELLKVPQEILKEFGPVSRPVACYMAAGAREALQADYAVAVTGLAGPGGDDYGNPVGTVCIGFDGPEGGAVEKFLFTGNREQIRQQTVQAALRMILEQTQQKGE